MKNFILLLLCAIVFIEGGIITNLHFKNKENEAKIKSLDCEVVHLVEQLDDMHMSIIENSRQPNLQDVYKYLVKLKVTEPKVVLRQCILESGWKLNSHVATFNNNLFGMKLPKRRPTTAISESSGHYAIYANWKHSVVDYLIWQNTQIHKYKGDYYAFLKKTHYAKHNKRYVRTLKHVNIEKLNL